MPVPVSDVIYTVAKAFEEGFKLAQTVEGQAAMKEARENRAKFGQGWDKFIGGIVKVFGQVPQIPPQG